MAQSRMPVESPSKCHAHVRPTVRHSSPYVVRARSGSPSRPADILFPLRQAINANIAAGHAVNNPSVPVTFPTDDSTASQSARITAAAVTLQNLHGPGVGCPVASTTLTAQQAAINAGTSQPSPGPASSPASSPAPAPALPASSSPTPAAPSPSQSSGSTGSPSAAQIAQLAPNLGFTAGKNPDGACPAPLYIREVADCLA